MILHSENTSTVFIVEAEIVPHHTSILHDGKRLKFEEVFWFLMKEMEKEKQEKKSSISKEMVSLRCSEKIFELDGFIFTQWV